MKKILLSVLALGLFITNAISKHKKCVYYETSYRKVNGKVLVDSFLVRKNKDNKFTKILINQRTNNFVYRGHGTVVTVDTTSCPKLCLIRLDGALIENDSTISPVKYILVYESSYYNKLKTHFNNGDVVYVEQKLFAIEGNEIAYSIKGNVDHFDSSSTLRKDIIFVDMKKQ